VKHDVDPDAGERTRRAWHAVAELVLAGPQHRRSGTIRLRVTPGGFATVAEPALAVAGGSVVAEGVAGGAPVPMDGRSCAELAATLGLDAGAPAGLYAGGSGVAPDERLDVDAAAAAALAAALARGEEALRRLAPDIVPVLWPEHFDLGIAVDEVNYGVSLGDGYCPEPYAYVGPWRPRAGAFWNAPFGAARPLRELTGDLLDFLAEGGRRAAADPAVDAAAGSPPP
jgi:hypothetical protein